MEWEPDPNYEFQVFWINHSASGCQWIHSLFSSYRFPIYSLFLICHFLWIYYFFFSSFLHILFTMRMKLSQLTLIHSFPLGRWRVRNYLQGIKKRQVTKFYLLVTGSSNKLNNAVCWEEETYVGNTLNRISLATYYL